MCYSMASSYSDLLVCQAGNQSSRVNKSMGRWLPRSNIRQQLPYGPVLLKLVPDNLPRIQVGHDSHNSGQDYLGVSERAHNTTFRTLLVSTLTQLQR